MKLIIDVKNCKGCPCIARHYGQGESWHYCSHPQAPDGYGNILQARDNGLESVPKWCPIAEQKAPTTKPPTAERII